MLSSISPVLLLLRSAFWEFLYGKADVLSPYAAELCLRKAALKDRSHIRVCPNVLYR